MRNFVAYTLSPTVFLFQSVRSELEDAAKRKLVLRNFKAYLELTVEPCIQDDGVDSKDGMSLHQCTAAHFVYPEKLTHATKHTEGLPLDQDQLQF